ncbi:hypothetical protein B0H16DRAFT_901597 [Mycena metata]|uniref:Uncharacterized protein n=1 Tax=Mycena metata TaxID=1033252 RepID=A0AAD7ITA7_9AGAR|nr:hypothetical protein B0H16DRAFT_901597 [Mycena metata]
MTTLLFCHSGLLLVSSGRPSSVDCPHNTAAFHFFFDTSSIVVTQDLVISGHPAPSTLTLLLLLCCFLCLPPVSLLVFYPFCTPPPGPCSLLSPPYHPPSHTLSPSRSFTLTAATVAQHRHCS